MNRFNLLGWTALVVALILVGFAVFGVLHVGHLLWVLLVLLVLLILAILFLGWPWRLP